MANLPNSRKRARQAQKRTLRNAARKTEMRTYLKSIRKVVESKDLSSAKSLFQKATSVLDKLANKGLIHRNKAARHKKRLSALIRKHSESV